MPVGVSLFDRKTNEIIFDVNFWHYHAVVEAVRSLAVLPEETVDALHESWQNNGLTVEQARLVAAAIRTQLLPTLKEDERLLLDGSRTTEPDDGTLHRDPGDQAQNYSTNRRVLERFAECCESCNGFTVC
jgi:hypothetical protein